MIAAESITEIQNLPVAEIVGQSVTLKQAGANLTGLCPFHNEKSPSFSINPGKNFYHCFGCGESGNGISFVMKTQGLSFPDAVEYLADKFSVTLKFTKTKNSAQNQAVNKKDLYKINSQALNYYQQTLHNSPVAKEYLQKRGVTPAMVSKFNLGFASEDWQGFTDSLKGKNFSLKQVLASGLVKTKDNKKFYDFLRGRIVFPIWQDAERIAGFGGRVLPEFADARSAKYLNSPETLTYQKSRILYGYVAAQAAIKETGNVYVVEGYLDVISLHQAGVANAVATCGTALTAEHLKKLTYVAKKLTLLFDGDSAGKAAAAKSFALIDDAEIDIVVKFLPDDSDPDDFAQKHGAETTAQLDKLPAVSLLKAYVLKQLTESKVSAINDLGVVAKSRLAGQILERVDQIRDPLLRQELRKELSFLFSLDLSKLKTKAVGGSPGAQRNSSRPGFASESSQTTDNRDTQNAQPLPAHSFSQLERGILELAINPLSKAAISELLEAQELSYYVHAEIMSFILSLQPIDFANERSDFIEALQRLPADWQKLCKVNLKQLSKERSEQQTSATNLYTEITRWLKEARVGRRKEHLVAQLRASADLAEQELISAKILLLNKELQSLRTRPA